MGKMTKEQVLEWKRGFEVVREAERRLVHQGPIDSERSVRLALELIDMCHRQGVWVRPGDDQIWEDQVRIVRKRWLLLKKVLCK